MKERFDRAFDFMIENEGGFVNHPNDPGGATNYGVSLRTLRQLGDMDFDLDGDGDIDVSDIRAMSLDDAKAFYRKHFWNAIKYTDTEGVKHYLCEAIPEESFAIKVFDMAVNMGARQANRIVQHAVNAGYLSSPPLNVDGVFGVKTMQMVGHEPAFGNFMYRLRAEQARFYYTLADQKPARAVFLLGWLRRAYK